jgi:hypothetical protein
MPHRNSSGGLGLNKMIVQKLLDAAKVENGANCYALFSMARNLAQRLANGQEYTSVVKVRKTGVEVYLDGKLIEAWNTDFSDMSIPQTWPLRRMDIIGVGLFQSTTLFRTIEVIEITSEGKTRK